MYVTSYHHWCFMVALLFFLFWFLGFHGSLDLQWIVVRRYRGLSASVHIPSPEPSKRNGSRKPGQFYKKKKERHLHLILVDKILHKYTYFVSWRWTLSVCDFQISPHSAFLVGNLASTNEPRSRKQYLPLNCHWKRFGGIFHACLFFFLSFIFTFFLQGMLKRLCTYIACGSILAVCKNGFCVAHYKSDKLLPNPPLNLSYALATALKLKLWTTISERKTSRWNRSRSQFCF